MDDSWGDSRHAAQHQLQLEREQLALDALMECKRAGAGLEHLETLAREMGLYREWRQYEATTQP